jgi:hypothetical protein
MSLSRIRLASVGLLAAVMLLVNAAPAPAQATLRYKFKKGDKLNYVMEQKIAMTMSVAGKDIAMDMAQTIDTTWSVASVDEDGKAKMTQTITRVRFTMDGPTGKVDYDSKEGKEPEGLIGKMIGPIFSALAGADIDLSMDATGKVSDVKVPDKLSKAVKNLPGGGAGLGEMFSEDGLKQVIDQSGLVLPKEPVAKGKSWEQKVEFKSAGGKMNVVSTNTYEGAVKKDGKELERVSLKPVMTLTPDPDAQAKITLKSQEAKGTAYFDNAAGRLVESNMTQNMEMQTSVMGMEFGQKLKQTVTMKLVDKAK